MRTAVLSGTITPRFTAAAAGSLAMMPMTVNGWPSTKMAGWFCRLEIPSWAAAVWLTTATFCARAWWNSLNSTPAASCAPLACSAPGVAAITGSPSSVPPLACGSALTDAWSSVWSTRPRRR